MKTKSEYEIAFRGLTNGEHEYSWELQKTFFDNFNPEQSFVNDANVSASLTIQKTGNMMQLHFNFSGFLIVSCDRCLDDLKIAISTKKEILVKEGKGESDDQIIFVSASDFELDVEPLLYDLLILEVPYRKVHLKGECNEEMMAKLKELLADENESEI